MPSFLSVRLAALTRNARAAMLLCACGLSIAGLGCHKRTVQAAPPVPIPAPPTDTAPPPEKKPLPPPEISPTPTPLPPSLVVPPPKPAPVKPHPAPEESPPTPKPEPPQISPQLTPAELAEAERQTKKDIDTAENNLQVAYGRLLNATQHDLVEKIRGFLGQSREGIRASDWVRARNLAQKARVLSVELVNSL